MPNPARVFTRGTIAAACATVLFPIPSALAHRADSPVTTGPSTSTAPYVIPVADGVEITSLLTTGDAVGGYRMAGTPDGLGAVRQRSGLLVTMNHEFSAGKGSVRKHGQDGAFISSWRLDRQGRVTQGSDLIEPGVVFWDYPTQTGSLLPSTGGVNPRDTGDTFAAGSAAFSRFCSGSIATYDQLRGWGGRGLGRGQTIRFGNEENGNEGRIFGVLGNGKAVQLPRLGLASFENVEMATTRTNQTVTVGGEDGGDGQLWIYRGRKQRSGDEFRRAGLTTGVNSVLDLEDASVTNDAEFRTKYGKGQPVPFGLSEVDWDQSGAEQNAEAKADGLTLTRIEDVSFDPRRPNVLYFVTTEGGDQTPAPGEDAPRNGGGLWRVVFDDIDDPSAGGTIELVLDGSEAPYLSKPDNLTVDARGNVLIQEDPGGNPHLARIVAYNSHTGQRAVLATFDPALFSGPEAITEDEESSGIIPADGFYGPDSFLFDAQVHKKLDDPELVEMGQLLSMTIDWRKAYSGPSAS